MDIHGLNKLTLLDYPGKTACTVFTGGCNFKCPYCHNASLVFIGGNKPQISNEEFFAFLDKRKNLLDGVCITGGEAALHKDLPQFIKKIKDKGFYVKLDTNGSNPNMLEKLICKKLIDCVAMDIKNSPEKYGETAGIKNFNIAPVKTSAAFLMSSDIEYEFRTTVVKEFHNAQSFEKIAAWLKGGKAYYLQQFNDSGDIIEKNLSPCTKEEMLSYLEIVKPYFNKCGLRGI